MEFVILLRMLGYLQFWLPTGWAPTQLNMLATLGEVFCVYTHVIVVDGGGGDDDNTATTSTTTSTPIFVLFYLKESI